MAKRAPRVQKKPLTPPKPTAHPAPKPIVQPAPKPTIQLAPKPTIQSPTLVRPTRIRRYRSTGIIGSIISLVIVIIIIIVLLNVL